jgi:hypothetical protein
MKVSELIEILMQMPQDAIICTNECEATTDHETITENIEIGKEVLVNDREFGLVLGSRIFIGPYLNEPRHLY